MHEIIIVGAGGHARVMADVVRLAGEFHICGFLDELHPQRLGESFEESTILSGDDALADLRERGVRHAAIAVGDNQARVEIAHRLGKLGFELPVLIHPRATVASTVRIGAGTLVCAGAVINPATRIGPACIVNTSASVDHDCEIEEGVHIAPGVHLGGHVRVGVQSLIGLGSAVKPGVSIGRHAVVGVGSAVVRDVADGQTVAGVPARVLA